MTIETLKQRLANAQSKLEKANKKYERILKAAEYNYQENNPYYYDEYDKRCCERDIEELTANIEKYSEMLTCEVEKSNSRDVKIILDFLNAWKCSYYNRCEVDLIAYYEEKQVVRDAFNEYDKNRYSANSETLKAHYDELRKALYSKVRGYFKREEFINRWGKPDYREVKVACGEVEYLKYYIERSSTLEECLQRLDKDLEEEKNRKYDSIIQRVNEITGEIIDANNLHIGGNGDLNGIIIGTRGRASVESVGCAGYNTEEIVNVKHGQCFHFRVYVKEVK